MRKKEPSICDNCVLYKPRVRECQGLTRVAQQEAAAEGKCNFYKSPGQHRIAMVKEAQRKKKVSETIKIKI